LFVYVSCMATKTISIDLEAYEALRRRKRGNQSFSEVIKEHFLRRSTAADLLQAVRDIQVDPSTLDAVEEIIRERGAAPARAADL
jgi:predicted CopG family antitoxin